MKIAIEGMDGVGKSTIAKKIAEKYELKYIEKPLTDLFETEVTTGKENLGMVSRNIYDLDTDILKAWFFGLGNIYTFDKYKDEDLVIDRHFASNYFWNGNERSNIIFKTMIELVGVPDITILLYASPKTRLKRLYLRNPNDYDLTDEEKHVDGYDKMIDFLKTFNIPFVLINTEDKTTDEVFEEVDEVILDIKKNNNSTKKIKKSYSLTNCKN